MGVGYSMYYVNIFLRAEWDVRRERNHYERGRRVHTKAHIPLHSPTNKWKTVLPLDKCENFFFNFRRFVQLEGREVKVPETLE